MSFQLNSDQLELQTTVRKFFTTEITSEYLKKRINSKLDADDNLWKSLVELGIFSLFSDADSPCRNLGTLSMIAFEAGQVLLPENLIDSLLCGAYLLKEDGTRVCVPISSEIGAIASKGDSHHLSGSFAAVPFANSSERLVFVGSEKDGEEKVYVASVKDGKVSGKDSLDLTSKLFSISFKDAVCKAVDSISASDFIAAQRILRANEAAGVCKKVVEMTSEYVKTRKQFGVPVGAFQAVQHQLAEIYLKSEALASLARFGAWAYDSSRDQLALASRSAIGFACEVGPPVVETAIQLHGGIGFTWEYDLHLYLRRIRTLEAMSGLGEEEHQCLLDLVAQSSEVSI